MKLLFVLMLSLSSVSYASGNGTGVTALLKAIPPEIKGTAAIIAIIGGTWLTPLNEIAKNTGEIAKNTGYLEQSAQDTAKIRQGFLQNEINEFLDILDRSDLPEAEQRVYRRRLEKITKLNE